MTAVSSRLKKLVRGYNGTGFTDGQLPSKVEEALARDPMYTLLHASPQPMVPAAARSEILDCYARAERAREGLDICRTEALRLCDDTIKKGVTLSEREQAIEGSTRSAMGKKTILSSKIAIDRSNFRKMRNMLVTTEPNVPLLIPHLHATVPSEPADLQQ